MRNFFNFIKASSKLQAVCGLFFLAPPNVPINSFMCYGYMLYGYMLYGYMVIWFYGLCLFCIIHASLESATIRTRIFWKDEFGIGDQESGIGKIGKILER